MRLVCQYNSDSEMNGKLDETYEKDSDVAIQHVDSDLDWPLEVDLILSAMDAAQPSGAERRRAPRFQCRVRADLRLFSEPDFASPIALYTRDLTARGLGFITRNRLPLGYGGMVEFVAPNGQAIRAQCTIYRCRESVNGWFEGALNFTRDLVQINAQSVAPGDDRAV